MTSKIFLPKTERKEKNLAQPDTLGRNTPPELLKRKTTVEIPQNINFYLAKDETSPRLERKFAVKTDIEQSQINNLLTLSTLFRLSEQPL